MSRSKGNQTMIFGQLIESNMRNIFFLKYHTQNAMEILFPEPFLKNQSWANLSINILKFNTACFYGMPSWGLSDHIGHLLLPHIINFLKKQKAWNKSSCLIFCMIFEEKYFSCYILLPDQISLSYCLYFVRYWVIYVM